MRIHFCVACVLLFSLVGVSSAQRVTFRQGSFDTALPPFGGYTPGGGATIDARSGGVRFRQGSFDVALPQFGGFVPGSGAIISFPRAPQRAPIMQRAPALPNAANARPMVAPAAGNGQAANGAQRDRLQARREMRRRRVAEELLKKGEKAEAAGQRALAEKYYRSGLKRNAPEVNRLLQERLAKLTGKS